MRNPQVYKACAAICLFGPRTLVRASDYFEATFLQSKGKMLASGS